MIPLFVFVAAAGLLYFAVVESAFGLLMRLPRRLEAERERAHDALGAYLNDPITFFVPARLMRGTVLIVAIVLLAQPIGTGLVPAFVLFGCGLALYVAVGQVLPAILVRRSPERVLSLLLAVAWPWPISWRRSPRSSSRGWGLRTDGGDGGRAGHVARGN